MVHLIIKLTPEDPLYVIWSTNSDGPLYWGTREEIKRLYDGDLSQERFDRADKSGSSAFYPDGQWGDSGFVVQNIGPEGFFLPRKNLAAWLNSLEGQGLSATFDASLTEPLEF